MAIQNAPWPNVMCVLPFRWPDISSLRMLEDINTSHPAETQVGRIQDRPLQSAEKHNVGYLINQTPWLGFHRRCDHAALYLDLRLVLLSNSFELFFYQSQLPTEEIGLRRNGAGLYVSSKSTI
jgi:hypothetical protein